ncbi:hypothetical protein L915_10375 [Phytophthora nicotianae]|uniref:Uncharacterized protein n=2 Tax=Phytophthora nicotianae TaxID=4792 RepID=W2GNV3_PHYNI|nr:hypothetical protein L915_10375 [Phytophthora nicotianae]ETO62663.1 hypothetical protein F444_19466 [Phytophthora nicotianae P1976]
MVMQWCEDLRPGAFVNYYKKHFARRDQASPAGGCFMDAFRAALYHLGDPGLASTATELWRSDFPLDYDLLFQSPLDASYTNVERFQTFVQTLRERVYLTSIGNDLVGHCVVVLVMGPDTAVEPPVTREP